MLAHLLVLLLKAKVVGFTSLQAPLIATLLVVSMTGFVVSGTVHAEDGDETVNLTVRLLESKTCVDALIAQTEALFELGALSEDAKRQLRHLRERAREQADDQRKMLDEAALRDQFEISSEAIRHELSLARQLVLDAADLSKCHDGDPNTTVDIDIADLRRTYDQIVRDFGRKLNDLLDTAQDAFDQLVANAPQRPAPVPSRDDSDDSDDGSGSHSRD
jgi:hypothetical protein